MPIHLQLINLFKIDNHYYWELSNVVCALRNEH